MNGNLWFDWLNYIRTAHSAELDWLNYIRTAVGAELFLALYLSTAFCARITEALMLRAQDFDWDREQVHFGAFKYGKSTDKPMVPSVKKQLLGVKRNGASPPSGLPPPTAAPARSAAAQAGSVASLREKALEIEECRGVAAGCCMDWRDTCSCCNYTLY